MEQQAITKDTKLDSGYKWGFETDIKSVKIPKGLSEKTISNYTRISIIN